MLTGLVLGSGGVKGYMLIGGLSFLARNGYLKNINHICGVSVGSIIALLYMCGYSPADMIKLSLNLNVPQVSLNQILSITTKLLSQGYLYDLKPLITQIDTYLKAHNFNNLTFKDLFNYTNITFSVIAYDMTANKKVYFSHLTHPDMLCLDAVRLSCALPILFEEQIYQEHCYIDGAFVSPCPLEVFDAGLDVLALITEMDLDQARTNINVLDKIMTIYEILARDKVEEQLEKSKCKYKIIRFKSSIFNPLSGALSDTERRNLFIQGYEFMCLNI